MPKYSYASRNQTENKYIIYVFAAVVVGGILGFAFSEIQKGFSEVPNYVSMSSQIPSTGFQSKINLAAVDNKGNGVVTPLTAEVKPGDGKILINIDKLNYWTDTQQSMQTARAVAERITGANAKKMDLIYSIKTDNATLVGGPSAGAALTIATISALQNKTLNPNIMITGTIEEDGSVGKVGGIIEKAVAAKAVGAKLFLVPKGEGTQVYTKPEEKCSRLGGFLFCETTYQRIEVSVGESVGIEVKEVANVEEAMKYFL
ncbi:MAG TPA: S16 family serine protease [archaeon]|nr:S16 family serine protease [archaeon]